jgi:hypothetical protein
MSTSLSSRVVQSLAVLASGVALLSTAFWISHLADNYMEFYMAHSTGEALPTLTRAVLGLTRDHHLIAIGALAGIVCLAIGYLLAWSARSVEASSVRLLAFVSVVWAAGLLGLGTAMLAFALPSFRTEEMSLGNPRIAPMLKAIEMVDRASLGFTPIPTNAEVFLEVTPSESYDTRLLVYGKTRRTVTFRKTQEGYQWIAEQEVHSSGKTFQTVDGLTREQLVVAYQVEPVKEFPLRKTCVSYVGIDPRLARRFDLTLSDVAPILAEWNKGH